MSPAAPRPPSPNAGARATGSSAGPGRRESQPDSILRFWRDVEVFNLPKAPTSRDQTDKLKLFLVEVGDPLPWPAPSALLPEPKSGYVWEHCVFIGLCEAELLTEVVLEAALGRTVPEGELERIDGQSWLGAFVVDQRGVPVPGTYVPASFVLGVGRLRQSKSLDDIDTDIAEASAAFDRRWAGWADRDDARPRPIGWPELGSEFELASTPLRPALRNQEMRVLVKSVQRRPRVGDEAGAEIDTDFLNSFFLEDLDQLIALTSKRSVVGQALRAYLGSSTPPGGRVDLLTDTDALARVVSATQLPPGRWPSPPEQQLSLGQQAAVFEAMERLSATSGLVAINGPPGTGKSTLLNDVVANVVVERARRIARCEHPAELFESEPMMIGGTNTFPLRSEFVGGTGIVVTSSNNAAVENITRELPAATKVDLSTFRDAAAYFESVADTVFDETNTPGKAWGLVAAALGNSSNRWTFARGFFRDERASKAGPQSSERGSFTMKQDLEQSVDDPQWSEGWAVAKTTFLQLIREFDHFKGEVVSMEAPIRKVRQLGSAIADCDRELRDLEHETAAAEKEIAGELGTAEAEHTTCVDACRAADEEMSQTQLRLEAATERLRAAEAEQPPRLIDRLLRAVAIQTDRYRTWVQRTASIREARARLLDHFATEKSQARTTQKALAVAGERLATAKERATRMRQQLADRRARLLDKLAARKREMTGIGDRLALEAQRLDVRIPDAAFWNLDPDKRQLTSLWVNRKVEELRSRIFLAALRLHAATIRVCARRFIPNFRAVHGMLARTSTEPIKPEQRGRLWDMLFFCVPVVSTTLASFSRLFVNMGQESLGWVLIDEAGQATPQSVVGALWRARRAVVVGDPLQIEPVMTVPQSLVMRLQELRGVDPIWSPSLESAQKLADRSMNMGAWVGQPTGDPVWTGMPLRAHRRCDSPMFDIANQIAYAGQMVQATTSFGAVDSALGKSGWFDVRGRSAEAQVVREEIQALAALLGQLCRSWPSFGDGRPATVFVISPFKRVARACDEVSRRWNVSGRGRIRCGTVHTFQGKEAEIVFFVLGSAPGGRGEGSRKWASQKPNLLNVALTRAKLRIYVVGNRLDWSRFFPTLVSGLEVREVPGAWAEGATSTSVGSNVGME